MEGITVHTVISGTDLPERLTIFLKHDTEPYRQFCFTVEAKLDGGWHWSACACGNANVSVSGKAEHRQAAMLAAEGAIDELNRCINFIKETRSGPRNKRTRR